MYGNVGKLDVISNIYISKAIKKFAVLGIWIMLCPFNGIVSYVPADII